MINHPIKVIRCVQIMKSLGIESFVRYFLDNVGIESLGIVRFCDFVFFLVVTILYSG